MYPEQLNNNYEGDGVFLYGLQGTSFYKETIENKVMKQLIDKSTLVAEIEKLMNHFKTCQTLNSYEEGLKEGRLIGYEDALDKINTLEVKESDETAKAFARIIRANLIGIDEDVQYKFEQLYKEITGEKMYQGYND